MKPMPILAAAAAAAAVALLAAAAHADTLTPEQQAEVNKLRAIDASLHPRTGDIDIPDAKVTLHLGDNYYFLDAKDAQNILVNAWDNPKDVAAGTIGLVFPKGGHFYDENGWAAVVTYEASGFIRSEHHEKSDFDQVEKAIRDGEAASNAARQKVKAAPIHFVGWAQPPTYDDAKHAVIWARDLKFGGQDVDTLNYDVRVLGRRGYLSLNMVSVMPQLAAVRTAATDLERTAQFQAGSRYDDFNIATDKTSQLGLVGLVAAGAGAVLAQKLGLFAVVLLFLKKGLVLIVAAVSGGAAWLRRRFGKTPPAKP